YTDEPVKLKARVTLGPDGAHFDTTGSDPQRRAPVNSTYAMTFSACAYMLKCLIDPDLPVNDGFYRVISLDAPAGTVTNGKWPGAVVGGWETQDRLVEVLFRALLPALPERIPAGTKGMMCQAGFGSLDVEAGTYTCFYETFAGGYVGRGGVEHRLGSKVTVDLEAGDVISVRTCGGGGYGPPGERDPELVRRDVREGKISAERARVVYGVET